MKWISIISAVLLTISVAACQTRENAEVEGAPNTGQTNAIPEQQRQAATTAIDNRLNDIQQSLSSLQSNVATAPEDVQDEIQNAVEEVQDEMPDIDTLRARMTRATTPDEWNDARTNLWQQMQEVDLTVSKARMQAADSLDSFREVVQDELQKLDQRVQDFDTEAASLTGTDRQGWDQRMNDFRQARNDFNQTWDQVQQATQDNWQDLQDDVVDQWEDLEEAFYSIPIAAAQNSDMMMGSDTTEQYNGMNADTTQPGATPIP
ncbi:MAG TPA: hypothetical protein VFG50_03060 [Rhodothermales bacterium]|nr:hypothetical protein [Rhodothermales bacterium]